MARSCVFFFVPVLPYKVLKLSLYLVCFFFSNLNAEVGAAYQIP